MFLQQSQAPTPGQQTLTPTPPNAEKVTDTPVPQEENLFVRLLHHTQDSHEIELPGMAIELPYLVYDDGGIHTFRNAEAFKESETYTLQQGKVLRKSDGHPVALDFSITKHVVFMWVAAVVLIIAAVTAARKNRKSPVPKGIGNLVEVFVVYIRDEILIPNMGKAGMVYLP